VAISVLQHITASTNATSGTTATGFPTFTNPLTAGSTVVLVVNMAGSQSQGSVTLVTTNGAAENWAQAAAGTADTSNGYLQNFIWVNPDTAGGQTTIDMHYAWSTTLSAADNAVVRVDAYEVAGLSTASSITDQTSGGGSPTATSFTSGTTGTTAQASEIAFGGVCCSQDFSAPTITPPGSPWVNSPSYNHAFFNADIFITAQAGYNILSAAQALAYAGTVSSAPYSAVIVTLKAPSGASNTAAAALTVTPAIAAGIFTTHPAAAALAVTPAIAASLTATHPAAAALTVTPAIAAHLTATHAAQAALAVTPAIRAVLGHTGLNTTAAALTVTPVIRATLFKPGTVTGAPFRVAPDDGRSSHRHRRRPLWG
jgi:hypothetical protein